MPLEQAISAAMTITLTAIADIPMVRPGDDLAALLIAACERNAFVPLDNVERLNWSLSRKDRDKTKNLQLNVKDVHKLKIVVTTGDFLDLGKHLTLAKPLVSK